MKPLIIWVLVILIGCHAAVSALAFDKEKLLTIKPLCSERIRKQSSDFKSNRLAAVGTFAMVFVGLFPINFDGTIDNTKLGVFSVGLVSLLGGTLAFFAPGDPVIQDDAFQKLGLTGLNKEAAAYAIMKNNAAQSKDNRKGSGLLLLASGIGVALLTALAPEATQSYKDTLNIGAAINIVLGLFAYVNPG
ncbi:MAG: hypothetical protein ABIB65_00895, partial [Candidatus Margulisiibacteriota bacterium]